MDPTDTASRGGQAGAAAPADQANEPSAGPELDDRGLLDLAVESLVAQNRAHAARLEAVHRFHANRVAETQERNAGREPGFFVLTPLQATTAELGPLLGLGETIIWADLDLVSGLKEWFPGLWRRCRQGRLDVGRARLAHLQLENLISQADKKAYAALVEAWLDRLDDPAEPLCTVGWRRFQAAVRRRCLKFPQREDHESFAEAFRKRRVSLRADEDGMATLVAVTAVTEALAADYRLTLIAKKRREADGEARTLQQLRVDTLVDLIHGRLTVAATTGELEDDSLGCTGGDGADDDGADDDGADVAATFTRAATVGAYARPVINVTVPITTLIGLDDTPGVLAGDISIPAELARQIAADPEATWHRLLTDPAGRFLELSATGYAPTAPLCRFVVARDRTCVWPGCSRPATVCEIDHRVPYPDGPTCTDNLQPLCRRHHLVKHSEGFSVTRESDGSYTWASRFGSKFTTPAPDYPGAPRTVGLRRRDVGSLIEHEFRAWMEGTRAS